MWGRPVSAAFAIFWATGLAYGQAPQAANPGSPGQSVGAWRPLGEASGAGTDLATASATPAPGAAAASKTAGETSPVRDGRRASTTRVSEGNGTLPNDHGQVWREYDISPYTMRVTTTQRPEQAIVDWILRETGYEAWHSEPLGVLSATNRKLRVYHTPEMQSAVADLIDRFNSSEAQTCSFSLRVVTLDQPDWRARAQRLMRPVPVQTPGTAAWLLEKEDIAVLLADLRRRADYREHSSPHLLVNNGQSTVVSAVRARNFVRDVLLRPDVWPGYEAQQGRVDEGFSMEFSPLLSADRQLIDATIKCDIDQVEKMLQVWLDVPSPLAPRQRAKIEVPQVTHFRFHERFRWPVGQVLLIGMGMVALPVPVDAKPVVPILPLGTAPPRADLLVFVESRGPVGAAATPAGTPPREAGRTYHGRY